MKKYLIAIVLIALIFTAAFSIGCEEQKFKKEIIKFDEEYWNLTPEYQKGIDELNEGLNDLPISKTINSNDNDLSKVDKLNSDINYSNKSIEITNDYIENYLTYINKFKALTIPSPLDDFYYKKIKAFDKFIEGNQKVISAFSKDLIYLKNYRDAVKNGDYSNSDYALKMAEERDELFKESDKLFQEGHDLQIDCDKLRREVYREYGLDDLITKWQ